MEQAEAFSSTGVLPADFNKVRLHKPGEGSGSSSEDDSDASETATPQSKAGSPRKRGKAAAGAPSSAGGKTSGKPIAKEQEAAEDDDEEEIEPEPLSEQQYVGVMEGRVQSHLHFHLADFSTFSFLCSAPCLLVEGEERCGGRSST